MRIAANTRWITSRVSLRLKLSFWMVLICLVLECTLAVVVLLYQRVATDAYLEARVKTRINFASDGIAKHDLRVTDEDLARIASELNLFAVSDRFLITLYRSDGSVVASNVRPAAPGDQLALDKTPAGSGTVLLSSPVAERYGSARSSASWRLALKPLRDSEGRAFRLLVGSSDASYDQMIGLTYRIVALTVIAGVAAAGLASWLIAGLATAPLHELRRLAGSLSPEGIDQDMVISPSSLSSQELAALRKELEVARARLRQALNAQDRFISSVSHELKTPIAVLLTEAQTIDARTLPDEPRKFVQSVTEEMRRLGRMVESFLTLTRVRGGMQLVSPDRCSINDVVIEAVQSSGKMARQYGVSVVPALADADVNPVITGDSELLRVMIDNLIHNAVRFSREGQRVEVSVVPIDATCQVRVRDFGPGVPEDLKDRLFERFVQAPGEAARGRGHGLGLSIAQGIAELHGGRIAVHNMTEGGGCEFTVSLPVPSSTGIATAAPGATAAPTAAR